jgi:hypothetical protein
MKQQHPPVHQLAVLSTGWCGISHPGTVAQFNFLTLTFGVCILFLLLVVFFPNSDLIYKLGSIFALPTN